MLEARVFKVKPWLHCVCVEKIIMTMSMCREYHNYSDYVWTKLQLHWLYEDNFIITLNMCQQDYKYTDYIGQGHNNTNYESTIS